MTKERSKQILDYMAKHSSPKDAREIIRRCQRALNKLYQLKKRYDKSGRWNAKRIDIPGGCPHCQYPFGAACDACLWTVAVNTITATSTHEPCTRIRFGGYTWHEVFNLVALKPDGIRINENYFDRFFPKVLFGKAVKFLRGHIRWANRKDWGSKL